MILNKNEYNVKLKDFIYTQEEYFVLIPWSLSYAVSNRGNVRSVRKGKNLRPILKGEYYYVSLPSKYRGSSYHPIHRLVAEIFLPPTYDFHLCHKNGNRLDNRARNIKYCNEKEAILKGWTYDAIKVIYDGKYYQSLFEFIREEQLKPWQAYHAYLTQKERFQKKPIHFIRI